MKYNLCLSIPIKSTSVKQVKLTLDKAIKFIRENEQLQMDKTRRNIILKELKDEVDS